MEKLLSIRKTMEKSLKNFGRLLEYFRKFKKKKKLINCNKIFYKI